MPHTTLPAAPADRLRRFEALWARATTCQDAGDFAGALAWYEQALPLAPRPALVLDNMGGVLGRLDRPAEALEHHRRAAEADPTYYNATANLGAMLFATGELDAAEPVLRRAMALAPDRYEAYRTMGALLKRRGDLLGAAAVLQRAVALHQDDPVPFNNLAVVLNELGMYQAALALLDHLVARAPHSAEAVFNRALLHLTLGDFARGWAAYGVRWRMPRYANRPRPRVDADWTGEPLAGRTLLLYNEQGTGDLIQFVRYAPLLAARGARVLVEAEPSLAPLLATCPGVSEVIAPGASSGADLRAAVMDLPHLLGTTLETIPAEVPYLSVPGHGASRAAAGGGALRVGLVWRGAAVHERDAQRSMALDALRPLLEAPGVEWVSLQLGAARSEMDALPPALRARLHDAAHAIGDWTDTARLVCELDLVIAVDTSIVHLAGALGRPVWVLVTHAPDFRWLVGRPDSPWYPTVRIFRQPVPGVWAPAVAEARAALDALVRAHLHP